MESEQQKDKNKGQNLRLKKLQKDLSTARSLDFQKVQRSPQCKVLAWYRVYCDDIKNSTQQSLDKLQNERTEQKISLLAFVLKQDLSCLKTLSFKDCNIYSIQSISNLNALSIQDIDFASNYITSLKPFAKLTFGALSYISIEKNNYQSDQLQNLTKARLKFDFKTLRYSLEKQLDVYLPFVKMSPQNVDKIKNKLYYYENARRNALKRRFHQNVIASLLTFNDLFGI